MSMTRDTSNVRGAVLLSAEKRWECPECGRLHVTLNPEPHSPMHQCAALKGAWVPFVEHGVKARLRINEREDFVGDDIPWTDDEGRVIMSVTTQRDEGEDTHIMAACVPLTIQGI
jgi:hypothetical protein